MLWSHDTSEDGAPANFHGDYLVAEDVVLVGSDTGGVGRLYQFDRRTGAVRWQHEAEGGFPADLVAAGGCLYAVTMTGVLQCRDPRDGSVRWSFAGGAGERYLRSSVVVGDDRVVLSLPSGKLFAVDPRSGASLWETDLGARINTTAARIDEHVYVGDLEGRVHRVRLADGGVAGRFAGEGHVFGALVAAGDCLLTLWSGGAFACLDPSLESARWRSATPAEWSSFRPLVRGDLVIVGDSTGELSALSLRDGAERWSYRLEGEIKGLGASAGVIYVGTLEGRVYALRLGR